MSTLQDLQVHGGRRRREPLASTDAAAAVPLQRAGWAGTERPCPPRRGSFLMTDESHSPQPPDDRRFIRVTIAVGATVWVAAGSAAVLWIA